jgi:hypothetical protein
MGVFPDVVCVSDVPRSHSVQLAARKAASAGDSRESYRYLMPASRSSAHLVKSQNSILEMIVMIATMVKHFEFSLPENDRETQTRPRIYRKLTLVLTPTVEGEIGACMGLVY